MGNSTGKRVTTKVPQLAEQSQAEGGINNDTYLSPLRGKQAFDIHFDNEKANLILPSKALLAEYLYPTNTMTGFEFDTDGLLKKTVDDGKRYFYSEIIGRKKIVNPLLGSFCGTQRIQFDSIQLIDDEVGPDGEKVYSVDGRDYVRMYGEPVMWNRSEGNSPKHEVNKRVKTEIIGFYNGLNILTGNFSNSSTIDVYLNGVSKGSVLITELQTFNNSPLSGRFVDASSIVPPPTLTGITLGVNTILLDDNSAEAATIQYIYGIELLQKPTLDANKNPEIIIPKQKGYILGDKYEISANTFKTHKPNVQEANYGEPGYNGEYDVGLDVYNDYEIVAEAADLGVGGDPTTKTDWTAKNVYDIVVNTNTGTGQKYYVLKRFNESIGTAHQLLNGTHGVWEGTDITRVLTASALGSATDLVLGEVIYESTNGRIYTVTHTTDGLYANTTFAKAVPRNGGRTVWYKKKNVDGLFSATNWLPPESTSITTSIIDDRANGQSRLVFKAREILESIELITNSTFDTNTTGWTTGGSSPSFTSVSGKGRLTSGLDSACWAYQAITCEIGKEYDVSVEINTTNAPLAGDSRLKIVDASTDPIPQTARFERTLAYGNGATTLSGSFVATATTHYVHLWIGDGVGYTDFDDVTVNSEILADIDLTKNIELAKKINFREFGSGDANGTTSTGFDSLSATASNRSYVLDDGLTTLIGKLADTTAGGELFTADTNMFIFTFIGCGLSLDGNNSDVPRQDLWVDLPYGTHLVQLTRNVNVYDVSIDGVVTGFSVATNGTGELGLLDFHIHQPNIPELPDDCIILSDYMLMADFVQQTAIGGLEISKGTRRLHATRDGLYRNSTGSGSFNWEIYTEPTIENTIGGQYLRCDRVNKMMAYRFTGQGVIMHYNVLTGHGVNNDIFLTKGSATETQMTTANLTGDYANAIRIGSNWDYVNGEIDQNTGFPIYNSFGGIIGLDYDEYRLRFSNITDTQIINMAGIDIITPIHCSNHYQEWETPHILELVGNGDGINNDNLPVFDNLKIQTKDEITKPKQIYYNNIGCIVSRDTGDTVGNRNIDYNIVRGAFGTVKNHGVKNMLVYHPDSNTTIFRILKDGHYSITARHLAQMTVASYIVEVTLNIDGNPEERARSTLSAVGDTTLTISSYHFLQKGQEISFSVAVSGGVIDGLDRASTLITIRKVSK